jgi:hypothetical protein
MPVYTGTEDFAVGSGISYVSEEEFVEWRSEGDLSVSDGPTIQDSLQYFPIGKTRH